MVEDISIEAYHLLERRDIEVTNQRDKLQQLEVLNTLPARMKRLVISAGLMKAGLRSPSIAIFKKAVCSRYTTVFQRHDNINPEAIIGANPLAAAPVAFDPADDDAIIGANPLAAAPVAFDPADDKKAEFNAGDRVRMRMTPNKTWEYGTVTSANPLKVRQDYVPFSRTWTFVEHLQTEAAIPEAWRMPC